MKICDLKCVRDSSGNPFFLIGYARWREKDYSQFYLIYLCAHESLRLFGADSPTRAVACVWERGTPTLFETCDLRIEIYPILSCD